MNEINVKPLNICERCKNKEATLLCQLCQPFKAFCNSCDTSLHSLPSKKYHIRDPIELYNKKDNILVVDNTTSSGLNNNNQNTIHSNHSQTNTIDNKSTNLGTILLTPLNQGLTHSKNTQSSSFDYHANYIISPASSLTSFKGMPLATSTDKLNYIDEKLTNNISTKSTLYTREYINELKNIFEKEKHELIFKNNSLQNNLDRLKQSMTDQVQQFQNQIEQNKSKNSNTLRLIDEENHFKTKSLLNSKDNEIEKLKSENEDLRMRLGELEIKYERMVTNNKERVSELNEKLAEKEMQINTVRKTMQNKIEKVMQTKDNIKRELENDLNKYVLKYLC